MLVTIIYNTNFGEQAASLKGDVQLEWANCSVNKMLVMEGHAVEYHGGKR